MDATQMNRHRDGKFAPTIFPHSEPIGEADFAAAQRAARRAYLSAPSSIRSVYDVDDLAQLVLISMSEKMVGKTSLDRQKAASTIAKRRLVDLTRELRGRKGQKLAETSIEAGEYTGGNKFDRTLSVEDSHSEDYDGPVSEDDAESLADQHLQAGQGEGFDPNEIVPLKPEVRRGVVEEHKGRWNTIREAYDLPDLEPVSSSSYVMLTQAIKGEGGISTVVRNWPDVSKRMMRSFEKYFPNSEACDKVIDIMRRHPGVAKDMVRTIAIVGAVRGLEAQRTLSEPKSSR
jgi:hypothetical protein